MRTNHVKELLRSGKPAVGGWLSIPSVATARMMSRVGFDWLVVDAEHTGQHADLMAQMVATIADAGSTAPLVRLPTHSVEWYKWALDAGAWGVVVPMVNTRAEAEQAVSWSKYPPQGTRSFGGVFGPYGFASADWPEYHAAANDEILVIVQIESAAALENIDAIMSVPGLDVAFIGPNDLHAQIGLPPSSEGAEPTFVAALDRIKAAAQQHNAPLGIYCSGGAAAAQRVSEGFAMVTAATDASCLVGAARDNLALAHNGK